MPPVILERPKMTRPMWDALKGHIMRERHRKKQELEQDAEVERQRKEREQRQKQHVLTLSETKEQIAQAEMRLAELKEEKHQLFLQLKKVLNEDEIRKRQILSQEANHDVLRFQYSNYPPSSAPRIQLMPDQGGHHHSAYSQQPIQLTRNQPSLAPPQGGQGLKLGHSVFPPPGGHHNGVPYVPMTLKRSRSPSPPPQHNYKFGPFKPPPQAIPQYPHQKPLGGLQYFHPPPSQPPQSNPNPPAPPPPQQHSQHAVSLSAVPHPSQSTLYSYSNAPPSRSPQQPPREEPPRHVPSAPLFIHHGGSLPRGYVLHQPVEHSRSSPHKFPEDGPKYYPPPTHGLGLRAPSHLSIHPGLTIQPSQVKPSSGPPPTGSITSGYPIRTQPNSSAYQGRPPSPQVAYSVPGAPPRLAYLQGHHHSAPLQQHPRYSMPPRH